MKTANIKTFFYVNVCYDLKIKKYKKKGFKQKISITKFSFNCNYVSLCPPPFLTSWPADNIEIDLTFICLEYDGVQVQKSNENLRRNQVSIY